MSINDLIEGVIIKRESLGVTRQQFSTILILGNLKDNIEDVKEYKSLREVLLDYESTTQEYKCASKIFLQQPSVSKVIIAQKKSEETWVACHQRFVASTKYAYCVIVANTIEGPVVDITDDELKALAVATEANEQIFAVNITPARIISIGQFFKDQNYKRVVTIFKDNNNDYPNAAIMGSILPRDPGTINLTLLQVSGIQPSVLSRTEKTLLDTNNINYYEDFSNKTNPRVGINCGRVANGDNFRICYLQDWVITTIKENLANLFLSKPSVPYNTFGFSLVSGAIMQALIEVANRNLVERVLSSDVIMPNLNRISEQDRIAGNGVTFRFKLNHGIKKSGYIYGRIVTPFNEKMTKETEDINQPTLIVGRERIEGGIDGDWLTWEPDGPLVEIDHDIGGNPVRRAMYNTSLTLTVTLSIGSEAIGFLNNMAVSRLSAPVTFMDATTDTRFSCAECAVNLIDSKVRNKTFTIIMINAS
jgi:hypothetical protein